MSHDSEIRDDIAYLLDVLRSKENTVFGKEHNFSNISTYEQYCENVQPSDYSSFREYVNRVRQGELEALITSKPLFYTRSSGTTGNPKLFPTTLEGAFSMTFTVSCVDFEHLLLTPEELEEVQEDYSLIPEDNTDSAETRELIQQFSGPKFLLDKFGIGKNRVLPTHLSNRQINKTKWMNTLRGKNLFGFFTSTFVKDEYGNEIGPVTGFLTRKEGGLLCPDSPVVGNIHPFYWLSNQSSPLPVYWQTGNNALTLHLYFALRQRDMRSITFAFAVTMCTVVELLVDNWREFVAAIRENRFPRIHEDLNEKLSQNSDWDNVFDEIKNSPAEIHTKRANELESIMREAVTDEKKEYNELFSKLWPNLKVLSCNCGGSMYVYYHRIEKLLSKSVHIVGLIYGASEAILGFPVNQFHYRIPSRRSVFVEYMDIDTRKTYRSDQLEENKKYEILITTTNGLYRYSIGDYIKCVKIDQYGPIFTIEGRSASTLNLVSEKTTEDMVFWSIRQLLDQLKIPQLIDFTIYPNPILRSYVFYIEVDPSFIPNFQDHNPAHIIEMKLREANADYARLRAANAELKGVVVHLIQSGSFSAFADSLIAKGTAPSQLKIPRPVSAEAVSFFDERITTTYRPL